jgi:hypothetical protein
MLTPLFTPEQAVTAILNRREGKQRSAHRRLPNNPQRKEGTY